jgi:hypothetical protein
MTDVLLTQSCAKAAGDRGGDSPNWNLTGGTPLRVSVLFVVQGRGDARACRKSMVTNSLLVSSIHPLLCRLKCQKDRE